jgi:hypothetical protein
MPVVNPRLFTPGFAQAVRVFSQYLTEERHFGLAVFAAVTIFDGAGFHPPKRPITAAEYIALARSGILAQTTGEDASAAEVSKADTYMREAFDVDHAIDVPGPEGTVLSVVQELIETENENLLPAEANFNQNRVDDIGYWDRVDLPDAVLRESGIPEGPYSATLGTNEEIEDEVRLQIAPEVISDNDHHESESDQGEGASAEDHFFSDEESHGDPGEHFTEHHGVR